MATPAPKNFRINLFMLRGLFVRDARGETKNRFRTLKEVKARVALFTFFVASILSFQNCGSFVADSSQLRGGTLDFASTGGSDLTPETDRVDPSCMKNPSFDACLFEKNPVAQRGVAFGSVPGSAISLNTFQTFGVKLTGLASTGRLENSTIRIETVQGTPVSTLTSHLRIPAQNDGSKAFTQVLTYYWLNRTAEYMLSRTGLLYAQGKKVRVVVDDTIAGWSPKSNSIHLKVDGNGNTMAWGPELAIHFFGLANLHFATNGEISNRGTGAANKHSTLSSKTDGYCKSANGCAKALASGVGDYFAAVMFPQKPVIGESWADSVDGIVLSRIGRNLNSAGSRTASAAFDARNGDVSHLGTVYASIWWEVRRDASSKPSGAQEVDTLFMHHLALLKGSDDFLSALEKIKSVDARLFSGRYSGSFDSQYRKRGLL